MSGRGANGNPPTDPNKGNNQGLQKSGGRRGHQQYRVASKTKFEGRCPDLKGNVFDIREGQADLFSKTQKEIELYVGRTYNNGYDVSCAVKDLVN